MDLVEYVAWSAFLAGTGIAMIYFIHWNHVRDDIRAGRVPESSKGMEWVMAFMGVMSILAGLVITSGHLVGSGVIQILVAIGWHLWQQPSMIK